VATPGPTQGRLPTHGRCSSRQSETKQARAPASHRPGRSSSPPPLHWEAADGVDIEKWPLALAPTCVQPPGGSEGGRAYVCTTGHMLDESREAISQCSARKRGGASLSGMACVRRQGPHVAGPGAPAVP
jgi:hypothetical protein